jgi:hypothetical protein
MPESCATHETSSGAFGEWLSLYSGTRQAFWLLLEKFSVPKASAASATTWRVKSECYWALVNGC